MTLLTIVSFFFFNDTATTEIYTLSLHDALPISIFGHPTILCRAIYHGEIKLILGCTQVTHEVEHHFVHLLGATIGDRKSTRLNSSHANISYAVFCLKKKKEGFIINCTLLEVGTS